MLVSGASLVGAEHPSLQQRNGQVDTRQQFVAFRLMSLHLPIMNISLQFPVRIEAVGANGASGLNALPDEAMKGFAIKFAPGYWPGALRLKRRGRWPEQVTKKITEASAV